MKPSEIKLLDCTIRDGGYLNDWDFSFEFVYRLLRVLDESGFDYAEVGFWNPKENGKLWKHCDIETLKKLDAHELGLKLVLLMDYGSCAVEDVPVELLDLVGLVRIAAHKKNLAEAADFAFALKQKGFSVTVNAMGITSYSKADLLKLSYEAQRAEGRCDYFYLADSFGALIPDETAGLFRLLAAVSDTPLGFHPHNNLELAVANTLAAMQSGAAIIDSSLLGIGRGGGNLRSEVIAAILSRSDRSKVNPLPLLSFADATFDRIGRKLGLCYDLEQVISGMAGCHPNYASALIGPRRLALDEIFRVIESIPPERKGQFSEAMLEEVISTAATPVTTQGESPKALASGTGKTAIMICPGAGIPPEAVESGHPIFSVNFVPADYRATGAIFGSMRRLWQSGDLSCGTPVYLSWSCSTLNSVPPHRVLDASAMETKVGFPLSNSGIRSLALLLEGGYQRVEVYGMSGFAPAGEISDGPDSEFIGALNREAVIELRAVARAYGADGADGLPFTLHASPLMNELTTLENE